MCQEDLMGDLLAPCTPLVQDVWAVISDELVAYIPSPHPVAGCSHRSPMEFESVFLAVHPSANRKIAFITHDTHIDSEECVRHIFRARAVPTTATPSARLVSITLLVVNNLSIATIYTGAHHDPVAFR